MNEFSRFRVKQLTPACGAELLDCDLSKFDDTLIEEVRVALQHRVVFFRDQDLSQGRILNLPLSSAIWKFIRQRRKTSPIQKCCALRMGRNRAARKIVGTLM